MYGYDKISNGVIFTFVQIRVIEKLVLHSSKYSIPYSEGVLLHRVNVCLVVYDVIISE